MRNKTAILTFIILTFNVTFINNSYGDTKRRCFKLIEDGSQCQKNRYGY